ncbi:protein GL2-INTERACTING REPRESSOR 1-like [Lolium rigidum]|uniref:protein GL2-INTERACTING REPRESSOR 1-like n=1 Tax=Lolium rigidum TaxID=89674 RepID=UPI001F5CBAA4|nr:protein GL2-INTERACTING REPRESSOR 1-like [Lolium rigidum]XP_047079475.1 protein GL2-INTERACTING REPRESSOR 1-like [Lolium rigidum]
MSRANGGRGARRLDLKLNLSLPARGDSSAASRRILAAPADEESSPSSCVSSESEQHGGGGALQWSDSPEATSMVLAACPRCFIYVMLAEADPRCPKCRSPVILDFLHGGNGNEGDESNNRNRCGGRNRKE